MKLNITNNILNSVNNGIKSSYEFLKTIELSKEVKKGLILGAVGFCIIGNVFVSSAAASDKFQKNTNPSAISHKSIGGHDVTNIKIQSIKTDAQLVKNLQKLAFDTNKIVLIDHETGTVSLADAENAKMLEGGVNSFITSIGDLIGDSHKVDLKAGSVVEKNNLTGHYFNSVDATKTITDLSNSHAGEISAKSFESKAKVFDSVVILDADTQEISIVDKNVLSLDKGHYQIGGDVNLDKPGSIIKMSGNILTHMDAGDLQHSIDKDGAKISKNALNFNDVSNKVFNGDVKLIKAIGANQADTKTVHVDTKIHQVIKTI